MKVLAAALSVLVFARGPCMASGAPGFIFTLGHQYTYKVEVKRLWRDPSERNLPNWIGEMKVWPLALQADGKVQVYARIAMNPDWPGVTRKVDATVAWTEFAVDPSGRVSDPYQFPIRSAEAAAIPLTFPLPGPGETSWQENRANGTEIDYRFSPDSGATQKPWKIEADYHNPRYEVQRDRFHAEFTYDPQAGRVLKWTQRGDYQEGAFIWTATTATLVGERAVPLPELAQIRHDSLVLAGFMNDFGAVEDDAEDPVEDLAAFRMRLEALGTRLSGLQTNLQDTDFREDCAPNRYSLAPLKILGESSLQEKSALLGKPAPDWTAKDLSGAAHALKDYRGKIVLLDFWGHGCGPCLRSVPFLNKIEHDYAGRPLEVIGVNVGDSPDDMRRAIAKMQMRNTQLLGHAVCRLYGVIGIPVYVLFDQEGLMRARHLGWDDSLDPVLRAEIDQLLVKLPKG